MSLDLVWLLIIQNITRLKFCVVLFPLLLSRLCEISYSQLRIEPNEIINYNVIVIQPEPGWQMCWLLTAAHATSLFRVQSYKMKNGGEIRPNLWKIFHLFEAVRDLTACKELTIGGWQLVRFLFEIDSINPWLVLQILLPKSIGQTHFRKISHRNHAIEQMSKYFSLTINQCSIHTGNLWWSLKADMVADDKITLR